jgi:hypothetical protein
MNVVPMAYLFITDVESCGLITKKCDNFVDFQKLSLDKKCRAVMAVPDLAA